MVVLRLCRSIPTYCPIGASSSFEVFFCKTEHARISQGAEAPPLHRIRRGATVYCRAVERRSLRARGQDHNVNWLVPAANCYPIGAPPWVLRLNQGVKRCREHNLALGRVRLKTSANIDRVT